MATNLTLAPLLFLTIVLLTTETTARPTTPAGPINIIAILEKGGQFTTFMRLLNITQVGSQINIQINNSFEGLTVFAPTDNAFQNLKPGTLNKLTSHEQLKLILYHIIPKFYNMDDFLSVSNPVRTQASGRDNDDYGLNITGQTNQINVSTGYVETRISNALREQRPLAVYVVDMVLLPGEVFGEHKHKPIAHAPKSPSGGVSGDTNSNFTKKAAASPSNKSGSDPKKHKHSPIAPAPVSVFAHIPAFAPAPKSLSGKVSDDTSNSIQNVAASPSDKSGSGKMKVVLGFGLELLVLCLTFLFLRFFLSVVSFGLQLYIAFILCHLKCEI